MADSSDNRYVSVPFAVGYESVDGISNAYGSVNARVGLFKALFKEGGDIVAGCEAETRNQAVRGHNRTRVIGEGAKTISGYSYTATIYPRKNVSFGKGGDVYKVLLSGRWWTMRVSGKQSTFHAFMCKNRDQLKQDLHYKTQNGSSYFVNMKDSE